MTMTYSNHVFLDLSPSQCSTRLNTGQQSEQIKCEIDHLIITMCHHYTAGYVRRSFIGIITAKIKRNVILAKLTKLCKIFNHQPILGYSLPIHVKEC